MKCTNHVFDGWEDPTPCHQEALEGFTKCMSCIEKQELYEALVAAHEQLGKQITAAAQLALRSPR